MSNDENVMLNEQENKAPENNFDTREMLRYNPNKLASKLGLFGMIFSMLGAFICLNSMNPDDPQVIFIILLNVVILLGGFLASEKVKAYNEKGAIAQFVFGGICAARVFYIPLILLINYAKYYDSFIFNEETNKWQLIEEKVEQHDAAVKNLGATITSKFEGSYANSFLPSSGYFRGITSMVFFALAAACFICSGLIGYKKAKELNSYMESIEKN